MKIHHIGYIVRDIGKAISVFETLGFAVRTAPVWDEGRLAEIGFLENNGYCVELVAPSKESHIYPLLKQYKNEPYHVCYQCFDIEKETQKLRMSKFMPITDIEPAPAIGGGSKSNVFHQRSMWDDRAFTRIEPY